MATVWPGAIDSYSTKVNAVTTIDASHINDLQLAVLAIEERLAGVEGDNSHKSYVPLKTDSTHTQFAFGVGEGSFSGVKDPSLFWGYNLSRNGSTYIDNTKPTFVLSMEADYYVDSGAGLEHTIEYNWGFNAKASIGYVSRPYQMAMLAEPAVGGADAWLSHKFLIGPAGTRTLKSWFAIGSDTVDPIFYIGSDGSFQLNYATGYGLTIVPKTTGGVTDVRFGMAGSVSANSYFRFDFAIGVQEAPTVPWGITAIGIKLTGDTPSAGGGVNIPVGGWIQGAGTGANGFNLSNLKSQVGTTLSGGHVIIQIDVNGTPYYLDARAGYS